MSELSIAELECQSVELLPQRETLSIIIINVSATAIAHEAHRAVAINDVTVPIINSNNTILNFHTHVGFFFGDGGFPT